MSKLYQQGDVLLFANQSIPEGCERVSPEARGIVLAEGEATGHAHTIDDIDVCEMWKNASTMETWIKTSKPVTIKHQEHKAITIPKGTFKIGIVREVDPFANEINSVKD